MNHAAAADLATRIAMWSGPRTVSTALMAVVALAAVYYLLAALAVTLWLWRDPASRTVAGNPNDTDQFTWFFRYDATAVVHLRLPALVTTAMNAPQGVNAMWNTFMMLPGVLLAPVTLLFGPQSAITVFLTAGFAGSATAMFAVLGRWDVSVPAAALGGAVYGFSPAVLHSAIGHYDLQFAVLPPLIVHVGLRLATGRTTALRGGLALGLLVTAQLFITEEILLGTAMAGVIIAAVLAASRPRAVAGKIATAAAGLGVAACVTAVIAGYPLWVQFFGPLRQHGSPFTPDFFKNDLSSFVVPSSYLVFHTSGSAAAALRYQGLLPEYLGYLGWPLIIVLLLAAIAAWRRLPAGPPRPPSSCSPCSRSAAPCCSAGTSTTRSSCPGTGWKACRCSTRPYRTGSPSWRTAQAPRCWPSPWTRPGRPSPPSPPGGCRGSPSAGGPPRW